MNPFDLDIRIAQAIDGALRSFEEHGFERPTTMVIGEDVQRALLATGAVPNFDGVWGHILGVEITGVSPAIGELLLGRNRPVIFRPQILGRFNDEDPS